MAKNKFGPRYKRYEKNNYMAKAYLDGYVDALDKSIAIHKNSKEWKY